MDEFVAGDSDIQRFFESVLDADEEFSDFIWP